MACMQVLSHLLLLVAVSVPALSCKLEDWRAATAAALPAYTHFLTPQQTLADFTWQMKRDAVSGRVKRSMEKVCDYHPATHTHTHTHTRTLISPHRRT